MNSLLRKMLLLLLIAGMGTSLFGQAQKITGKITSANDGKPMSAVSIMLKGKPGGTESNLAGEFSIDAAIGDVLVISSTGFATQEIKVGATTTYNIALSLSSNVLDDVVVVGYGTQSRKTFTGASSSVNAQAFEHTPNTNVATALQGTVPGLRVQQSTGQPGTSPSIVFRGGIDFNGNGTPLFVVDGVIVPSLYGLDMNDIESMDLLKDAASTAIYGARASNGVVLVSTKKGKKGKSQVMYSFSHTTNFIRRNSSDYLSGADYLRMNRLGIQSRFNGNSLDNNTAAMNADRNQLFGSWGWAINNGWTSPSGLYTTQLVSNNNRPFLTDPRWKLLVDENPFVAGQKDSLLYTDLDVPTREDMILQQNTTVEHSLAFSGANDQGAFALSVGTVNDQGMIIGSYLKRSNLNFNGSLNVGRKMKISTNMNFYNVSQGLPYTDPVGGGGGGLMQRFIGVAPTVRYVNDTSGAILPGPNDATLGNPAYWSTLYTNSTNQQRFMGGINLEYSILPYLKFLASGSGYMQYTDNNFFTRAFQLGSNGAFNTNRPASFNNTRDVQYMTNAFLQFNKNYSGHTITALFGAEYFEFQRYVNSGFAQGAPTDLIPWLTGSTSPSVVNNTIVNPSGASSNFSGWERLASLIGRVNYAYRDKYLVTAIVRYDGSSRLNSNNAYGTFPGVSVGWNLHNENFFKNSSLPKYISTIKPRISYGVNGNVSSLGYFATAQVYNNAGVYNGAGGTYAANYINPNLRWERSNMLNMGADLGFVNNRVKLGFDYFIRNVYDKISSLGISAQTGFSGFTTNLAQLQNRGIEFNIDAMVLAPKRTGGLSINIGGNLSTAKTFVVKLPFNGLEGNRTNTFQVWDPKNPGKLMQVNGLIEGQRAGLDEVWAPRWNGIYRTDGEITKDANVYNAFLPYNNKRIKQLGDARWDMVNGNDTIDSRQFQYVGRTTPQVVGSFFLNAGFKGIRLFAGFDYATGFVILNNEVVRGLSQVQGSQNSTTKALDTWAPTNTNGTMPRFYWANQGRNYATDASGNNPAANLWEKGDYIMFRELTVNYDLATVINNRNFKNVVKGLNVFITGNNLYYFSGYSGNLPEVGGIDNGRFPLPRRLTLGARVIL